MEQMKSIGELSSTELKAIAYEIAKQMNELNQRLGMIEGLIQRREQAERQPQESPAKGHVVNKDAVEKPENDLKKVADKVQKTQKPKK